MNTSAPTPIQVDVIVLDIFIFAMEERAAQERKSYNDTIAFRVRKQEAKKRLRDLTLEYGQLFPGRRELRGIQFACEVACAAPHALSLCFQLQDDEPPSLQTD